MSDPSPIPWFDVIIILALVVLNGVLSMSELAIVSSREARLKAMAKGGSSGAQCALDLAANPGRFLSTVQIGITLVGILAGAYSGAALGRPGRRAYRSAGGRAGDRGDDRVRHRHRPDDLRIAGDRRDRAEAVRASLARADRGARGAADALAFDGHGADRLAARPDERADLQDDRPQPRIREHRHGGGTAPRGRRGADGGRPGGKRASDHLRHRPPCRPPGARGDDSADRSRLDRRECLASTSFGLR